MARYDRLKVPSEGSRITVKKGKLKVPNDPIIPFIIGDGTGPVFSKGARFGIPGAIGGIGLLVGLLTVGRGLRSAKGKATCVVRQRPA